MENAQPYYKGCKGQRLPAQWTPVYTNLNGSRTWDLQVLQGSSAFLTHSRTLTSSEVNGDMNIGVHVSDFFTPATNRE